MGARWCRKATADWLQAAPVVTPLDWLKTSECQIQAVAIRLLAPSFPHTLAFGTLTATLLGGCVPMVVAVYVPDTECFKETRVCSWPTVFASVLNDPHVRITAQFAPSNKFYLFIRTQLTEGFTLQFTSLNVEVNSTWLQAPVVRSSWYSVSLLWELLPSQEEVDRARPIFAEIRKNLPSYCPGYKLVEGSRKNATVRC
jgi:hypothetical protein